MREHPLPTKTTEAELNEAAHRAEESARMKNFVREKIKRTYDLDELDLKVSWAHQQWLNADTTHYLKSNNWTRWLKSNIQAADLWLNEEQTPYAIEINNKTITRINALAKEVLQDYRDAYKLRTVMMAVPSKKIHVHKSEDLAFYSNKTNRYDICNAYINHVTNRAIAQFEMLGLKENSAFAMVGNLIGHSLSHYILIRPTTHTKIVNGKAFEVPQRVYPLAKGVALSEVKVNTKNYWQKMARELNQRHGQLHCNER